jgi:hypothetical protein
MTSPFRLSVLPQRFTVARLRADDPIPPALLARAGSFVSITRTPDELSIICPSGVAPESEASQAGWRAMRLEGQWDFGEVGVLAAIAAPLAARGVAILVVGTFRTDYILVAEAAMPAAVECLRQAGCEVVE